MSSPSGPGPGPVRGPAPDLALVRQEGRRLVRRSQAWAAVAAVAAGTLVVGIGFGGRALAHGDDAEDPPDTTTTSGTSVSTTGATATTAPDTTPTTEEPGTTGTTGTTTGTTGTTEQVVIVPDVRGRAQPEAAAALQAAGLVPTVQSEPSLEVAAGNVLSQQPAAGAEVEPGTTVAVTVSSGPPPEELRQWDRRRRRRPRRRQRPRVLAGLARERALRRIRAQLSSWASPMRMPSGPRT